MKSYDPNYIKYKNRKLVFDLFMEEEELSRAEVTRRTTMSFPTVLKVVNFMLSKNILIETGDTISNDEGMGRKGRLLRLNSSAYGAIGVVVEGQYIHVGLVNLKGELLENRFLRLEEKEIPDFSSLEQCIYTIIDRNKEMKILGIGVGLPKNVDTKREMIIDYSKKEVEEINIKEYLKSLNSNFELPVFVENDVNMSSIGEVFLRNKAGAKDLVYISLGSGLGSGIILDGKLRRGSNYMAGEIGALLLEEPRQMDFRTTSQRTIEKKINIKAIREKFGINIGQGNQGTETLKQEIIEYICPYVALLIHNFVYMMDVDEFVISGMIPEFLGEDFYLYLKFMMKKLLKTNIKISSAISPHGGIIGGGVMVFEDTIMDIVLA